MMNVVCICACVCGDGGGGGRTLPGTHPTNPNQPNPPQPPPPNHPQIAVSSVAMVAHGLLALGLADFLATVLPAPFVAVARPWVDTHLLPALWAYNATVNFPNVLRQSCLVVRCLAWALGFWVLMLGCWGGGFEGLFVVVSTHTGPQTTILHQPTPTPNKTDTAIRLTPSPP